MSNLKLVVGSKFMIAKFSHGRSNLPIGPAKLHGPTVLHGHGVEAVHLHGTYMQTIEENVGEHLSVVL